MARFSSDPEQLVASIVALSERTNRMALDSGMEAAGATVGVGKLCRFAIGAGVATGGVAWLVAELGSSKADSDQLATAAVAIVGLQASMFSVASAVEEVADPGGPIEVRSSTQALRRAGLALEDLLLTLPPCA